MLNENQLLAALLQVTNRKPLMSQDIPSDATFEFQIRVYVPDTDAIGVVYHGTYLRFADIARTEWLRALDYPISRMKEEFNLAPVVARVEVDYKRPSTVDDLLTVKCSIESMSAVRSVMRQDIYCDGQLRAGCLITLVWVHAETGRPQKLPESFTDLFNP